MEDSVDVVIYQTVREYFGNSSLIGYTMVNQIDQTIIASKIIVWYTMLKESARSRVRNIICERSSGNISAPSLMFKIGDLISETILSGAFKPQVNYNTPNQHLEANEWVVHSSSCTQLAFDIAMQKEAPLVSVEFLLYNNLVGFNEIGKYFKRNMEYVACIYDKVLVCAQMKSITDNYGALQSLLCYSCRAAVRCCESDRACRLVCGVVKMYGETGILYIDDCLINCKVCCEALRGRRSFENIGIALSFLVYLADYVMHTNGKIDPYMDLFESALDIIRPGFALVPLCHILIHCDQVSSAQTVIEYLGYDRWPGLAEQLFHTYNVDRVARLASRMHLSVGLHCVNFELIRLGNVSLPSNLSEINELCMSGIYKCESQCDYDIAASYGIYTPFEKLSDDEMMMVCVEQHSSEYLCVPEMSPIEILYMHCSVPKYISPIASYVETLYKFRNTVVCKAMNILWRYANKKGPVLCTLYNQAKSDLKKQYAIGYINSPMSPMHIIDVYTLDLILGYTFPMLNCDV